ncbi:NUMOD3 domain-containing DNA-binding protein [Leptothrix discophora]|uniref:NUMOD3 domain-containing DNA-binding protein n=1 Tax=Leptothrix discophora TaxID=89 RepID=A0ABT9G0I1_LEPDI|nr:NUMOD3 domain-containing DNA-binding protein [Leptothrix discophora]MDP4299921.1 NUMOD3 domain-containing DNA-binding protein [Leptothrix discophora]
MQSFYIYLYRDPKDQTPVYVGKGIHNRAYIHGSASSNPKLKNLIRCRRAEGYVIEPTIHYEVDEATALEMEKFWINFFGRADLGEGTLFNLTDGGDGCGGWNRGRVLTPSHKAAIGAANKGRKCPPNSEEVRKRKSEAAKGRPKTEEHKKKLSLSQIGRKKTPEQVEKNRQAQLEHNRRKRELIESDK